MLDVDAGRDSGSFSASWVTLQVAGIDFFQQQNNLLLRAVTQGKKQRLAQMQGAGQLFDWYSCPRRSRGNAFNHLNGS